VLAGPRSLRCRSDPTETEWLPSLIAAERGWLAFVSAHRYPFSACQTDRAGGV
jgi:hypothetical protein